MCDEMIWALCTQDVNLHLLISDIGVRKEAVVIQCQTWIRGSTRRQGDRNLPPIVVSMAPEDCSPFSVEFIERFIATTQPGLELLRALGTVTAVTEFVVNLPANHCRVMRVMICHLIHNAICMLMV